MTDRRFTLDPHSELVDSIESEHAYGEYNATLHRNGVRYTARFHGVSGHRVADLYKADDRAARDAFKRQVARWAQGEEDRNRKAEQRRHRQA